MLTKRPFPTRSKKWWKHRQKTKGLVCGHTDLVEMELLSQLDWYLLPLDPFRHYIGFLKKWLQDLFLSSVLQDVKYWHHCLKGVCTTQCGYVYQEIAEHLLIFTGLQIKGFELWIWNQHAHRSFLTTGNQHCAHIVYAHKHADIHTYMWFPPPPPK